MQSWTPGEMYAHWPCSRYPLERLVELWAGRERLTVLDILNLDIPAKDRIWAALQAGPHLEAVRLRIVERAIRRAYPICDDPEWRRWADRWLSGQCRDLDVAYSYIHVGPLTAKWAVETASSGCLLTVCYAAVQAAKSYGIKGERKLQLQDIRESVTLGECHVDS